MSQTRCLRLSVHNESTTKEISECCNKYGKVSSLTHKAEMNLVFVIYETREGAIDFLNACRNGEVVLHDRRVFAKFTQEQDPALKLYIKASKEKLEEKEAFSVLNECMPSSTECNAEKGFAILLFKSVDDKRKAYDVLNNTKDIEAYFFRPRNRPPMRFGFAPPRFQGRGGYQGGSGRGGYQGRGYQPRDGGYQQRGNGYQPRDGGGYQPRGGYQGQARGERPQFRGPRYAPRQDMRQEDKRQDTRQDTRQEDKRPERQDMRQATGKQVYQPGEHKKTHTSTGAPRIAHNKEAKYDKREMRQAGGRQGKKSPVKT